MQKRLLLFDVDGTLITRCSLHGKAFYEGLKQIFGVEIREITLKTYGMTDRAIVLAKAEMCGLTREQVIPKLDEVFAVMKKYFLENISNDDSFGSIPGTVELLEDLEARGHILGLLTGNLEAIAEAKMKKLGLLHFFKVGAFGHVTEIRHHLVDIAKGKASNFGLEFDNNDIFVIGDTPKDVECGKNAGVRTIAVATGAFSYEALKECRPDFLFRNFLDKESVIRVIES